MLQVVFSNMSAFLCSISIHLLIFVSGQKMAPVTIVYDGQEIEKSPDEDQENEIKIQPNDDYDDEINGYNYDNLYGLLSIRLIGFLISVLTYLLKNIDVKLC